MHSLFQNGDHHFGFSSWGSPFWYGDSCVCHPHFKTVITILVFQNGDTHFNMGTHDSCFSIWWSPFQYGHSCLCNPCFKMVITILVFWFGDLHFDIRIHAYAIPISKQWSLFWFFKMGIPISIWGLMLFNLVIPISIWAFMPMQSSFQNDDHYFGFSIWGSPFWYGIHAYAIPVLKQLSPFRFFKMEIPISIWGLVRILSPFLNGDHYF